MGSEMCIRDSYLGGLTPLPLLEQALAEALKAVKALKPGLKGYVGVDLILAKEEAWVVEVNPRLTTSYLGLRKILKANPASLILNSAQGKLSDELVEHSGFSAYLKVKGFPKPLEGFEFHSPLGGEGLLVGWAENLENLILKFKGLEGVLEAEVLEDLTHAIPRLRHWGSQY